MNKTIINWIKKKQRLYCIPGDFYIDPILPVNRALITHGHSDHAKPNNKKILCSIETKDIMKIRYGKSYCGTYQIIDFNESLKINNVIVKSLPAGHILGSTQFLIEFNGYKLLVSGDYKRRFDPTCSLYEPTKCDTFITEATFGLPIFKHPEDKIEVQKKLINSLEENKDSTHLVGVYALGKCQRLISLLRQLGYEKKYLFTWSLMKITEYYAKKFINLSGLKNVSLFSTKELQNNLIFVLLQH